MHRLTPLASVVFLSALMSGCSEETPPTGIGLGPVDFPISFAKKIRGGGFDGESNTGPVGTWPPDFWVSADDIGSMPVDEDPQCRDLSHCPVGAAGLKWFAGLREPVNPDPNPDAPEGNSGGFGVISTTNFRFNRKLIVTEESAIKSLFPIELRPRGPWQLQVDLAFLTGEVGPGAQNDSATIRIRQLASDDTVTVIRLKANDPLPWKRGGCRWQSLGGITSNYPHCTDWIPYSVDVSRFSGQKIEVEIRVREGGADNGIATSLAIDNLKFVRINVLPQIGRIRVSPATPLAGTSVEGSAEFSDGDAGDTHSAVWNWGDGSTSPGNLTQGAGSGSVKNNHVYSKPGTDTITLTVIDNTKGRGMRQRQISVQTAGG